MSSVNKKDLVHRVAVSADVTDRTARLVLNALLKEIEEAVTAGEKITLTKFGTFEARHRQARAGRNPQTGEPTPVPARTVPAFKVATAFRDRVSAAAAEAKAKAEVQ